MNRSKIYIDGQYGTTGLEIFDRLKQRDDIELLIIPEHKRHDHFIRQECMAQADLIFLCLPDSASIEAMNWIPENTKVIDASTAHRTKEGWDYGFPELSLPHKEAIASSYRVANPGCHATGFISIVYPLVQKGILSTSSLIRCTSLTGYSGGGKKMIEEYQTRKTEPLQAPRLYGLSLEHKHLKEMKQICHLNREPLFVPIVDDYYRGMLTSVMLEGNAREIYSFYQSFYPQDTVRVLFQDEGYLSANSMKDKDTLEIVVSGNGHQVLVSAVFDNLGKGACGAAIQNMNLMLGIQETKGLRL